MDGGCLRRPDIKHVRVNGKVSDTTIVRVIEMERVIGHGKYEIDRHTDVSGSRWNDKWKHRLVLTVRVPRLDKEEVTEIDC